MTINGSKMHYLDEGNGDPIVFIHGNPTSSYLWRNIFPTMIPHARCIVPDLIGMGKSDKPDLDYRFTTHYDYIVQFIAQLDLKNVTLVIHDWGSGLGFHYAYEHQDNVKGIAFMEAIYKPLKWDDFPLEFRILFKLMRAPFIGFTMISVFNFFVKNILPKTVVRPLHKEEMEVYKAPYPTIKSRKPVRQWPLEIPIEGAPNDMHDIVSNYHEWLKKTEIPKLLFYAKPGGLITVDEADWIVENFPNTESIDIGQGIHFIQEDNPQFIAAEIEKWYLNHFSK